MPNEPIEMADLEGRWFFRPREVSERAGVSLSEVYRSIYSGELKAKRYKSKVWLISRTDVEAWINECSQSNQAA